MDDEYLEEVEGELNTMSPQLKDKQWWGVVIRTLKKKRADQDERKENFNRVKELHQSAFNKKEADLKEFEALVTTWLESSPFEHGQGFKVDQPHIGSITLSKPVWKFDCTDEEYWIGQGFDVTKTTLDKKGLNTHLKGLDVVKEKDQLVRPHTGEVVKGITVAEKRSFIVR